MAGVTVTIEIDDYAAQALLTRLQRFGDDRLLDFYRDVGPQMVRSTRERGKQQVTPGGQPWTPLSEDYAEWKREKRPNVPILQFDFHMLGDMLSYQASPDELLWGTNAKWGATHQFGRGGIPEREWLGVSADDRDYLLEALTEHLEAAANGD